ncbi:MAG: gfo/Idh/MocA family oxidoreductase [Symbiobacterium thermophilum]|uniref:Gfo/Idh/MocA family oxidoreductase n=2 Tax=Symbiobacterium thermophilum TaxID=2734 RepID=A0A953LHK4_SYMTR|nr:gfo/Idh/MocA family oxidoreductase [Symbiobacterium thermophilum]
MASPSLSPWRNRAAGDGASPSLSPWRNRAAGDGASPSRRPWRNRAAGDGANPSLSPWRIGMAGAGAFGRFVLTALAALPDVELAAVAARSEASRAAALAAWRAAREGAGLPPGAPEAVDDAVALAQRPDLDAVLVATPPDLQPQVAGAAIAAGKALFLEKPGALAAEPLRELALRARSRGVVAALNFVMRASPLIACVRRWYRAGLLGLPERWHVENWAGGELPPDHWFWDRSRSGGVLIEHGVHFFDEAAWVLGGRPVRAWGADWPHPRHPDAAARALAAVEYAGELDGRPWHLAATFYHGFVRRRDEHQVRELGFTAGWLRIEDWIPRRLTGVLRVEPEAARALQEAAADLVRVEVRPLPDGRTWVEAAVAGGEATYREMIREGFVRLRRAAEGEGEPLAPLTAGVAALQVAEAASAGGWRAVDA